MYQKAESTVSLPSSIVIVGAGHAGCQLAFSLRQLGHAGRLVLVDAEGELPYQRPPLSKAYLTGQVDEAGLHFKPAAFYDQHGIERLHASAEHIDRERGLVHLVDGRTLPYDHLVLASGARTRLLDLPGAHLGRVHSLRTLADARALRPLLPGEGGRVAVLGAGFIGLEFAAVAALHGCKVQIVELGERPMARAVSPAVSAFFVDAHQRWGSHWHLGASLRRLDGADGRLQQVTLASGVTLPADLLVYGIGVVPNAELAARAGLAVDNGIEVDALLQTADPRISAIGDVAAVLAPGATRRQRIESVQNALDQARCLAARLTGAPAPYHAWPWFWSDQGDLKLQIVGQPALCDEFVVPAGASARELTVLGFAAGRLAAVETVNRPAEHLCARKGLGAGKELTPGQARQPGFDLKVWSRT
jgi:3-phenylpropionate/trans-cinnamate dioxygenase ferredoxin reductase subunit